MRFENACRLVVCQKWVFSTKTERNQKKKKKDFHGINKILRIFMIKFRALLSFFCFYYLIGVRYWCDFT
ncbi:hypothetical protein DDP32_07915 [Helicobacter pylori]|nr:hypothetical protein DDP32_07915 [Helicobacter pylori]